MLYLKQNLQVRKTKKYEDNWTLCPHWHITLKSTDYVVSNEK
uniref:Uncharacterized protein n=1 Tax=Anguilla anguilla TaxID=7936 RepID=A0A0E9WMT7_ANGAN